MFSEVGKIFQAKKSALVEKIGRGRPRESTIKRYVYKILSINNANN